MTERLGRDHLSVVPAESSPHRVEVYKTYLDPQGRGLFFLERARDLSPGEDATPYKWYASCQDCFWSACSWSWWREWDVLSSGMDRDDYLREQGLDPENAEHVRQYLRGGALLMALDHVKLLAEPFEWVPALPAPAR